MDAEKKYILLVEDSRTQALFARRLLEGAGYRVTVAETGRAGIELAQTTHPDLLLLDVVLPDIDGFEICRFVRRSVTTYIPILIFTGERTGMEDRIGALTTVGADDYLAKPYNPRELLAHVEALLRIKNTIDELLSRLTSEKQSYQALRRIALTDYLTGLYNRHYFAEVFEKEFSFAMRYKTALAIVLSDIDLFREVNNKYGHPTGDWVLQNVSALMQSRLRLGDAIARYGGEEFVMILPMTDAHAAAVACERLREQIEQTTLNAEAGPIRITVSFGIAAIPALGVTKAAELLERADKALYQAKHTGRNRVEIFNPYLPPAPAESATK